MRLRPGALPARAALAMATRDGARALGLLEEVGSIEVGKRADLILVDAGSPHVAPAADPFSTVVYAARPDSVQLTMVDGEILMRNGSALHMDAAAIAAEARTEAARLAARAGL
jgi:5-methylthioadenosine/S-adenosylhomocysteine deaminase